MKGIMITAPSSGSGKTMVTIGVIKALRDTGFNVCGFKTGPDYIDTSFISRASGKEAGNLDMHLQGQVGMKQSLGLGEGEYCIIEGAMGYFDGIYNTYENSSFHIAKILSVNSILVYTPQNEMFSAVPKIKGMADFPGSTIKGVILNRVSEKMFHLLKDPIEKFTGLHVLGFVPSISDLEFKSRHLGLVQSVEISDINSRIQKIADIIKQNINLSLLIKLMADVKALPVDYPSRRNIKVAVARDKAFSFYYRENLNILSRCCDVVFFSPLTDTRLPQCDLLYLGGGYPEVFKDELALNTSMLASIKAFADRGGCIFAEGGGFMYLMDYIEDCKMAGVFKGKATMTDKLQQFGYIDIKLKKDCMLGKVGDKLTGHEFHKSVAMAQNADTVYSITKTKGDKTWSCGYKYKNVLAGYPHISFFGNINSFLSMLDYVDKSKEGSLCI
ncbi:cobyrinate a,c-diamide synthase [Tepidanaerobacter sp. GT38]|uniref:cobyrinate a,c-diamide synthase n=1 Tax=Tepidanaerobacter sp. GT38 TaxID=2722793 RepID=UPI001F03281D|nr:cobyrinate a,c-diamide synthase [Tepidanaerobacter sp. GT38]MCG1011669.1 cobyrinate a,c-diamide synthase [Tepidanaerobacter sp. GT38]